MLIATINFNRLDVEAITLEIFFREEVTSFDRIKSSVKIQVDIELKLFFAFLKAHNEKIP